MLKLGLLIVAVAFLHSEAARTINGHLSGTDIDRLTKVFDDGIKSNDLQSVYYSTISLKQIKPEDTVSVCQRLQKLHTESKLNEFEKNFYLTGTHSKLSCPTPIPGAVLTAVSSSLSKDSSTAQELYFNYFSNKNVGNAINEATKERIGKLLHTILKTDDSLSSVGHAFHVAADIGTHGVRVTDWIEGTFAQADEIDGKLLQFEGGLSISALLLNGAFKLTSSFKKPLPLNEDQATKFTNYLLSRKSVQQPKGAAVLLDALRTIAADKKLAPVCIQLIGNGQLQPESPVAIIKVVDILGEPLSPLPSSLTATVKSKSDNTVLASKVTLVPKSHDKTVFGLDLTSQKPARGSYTVELTVDTWKQPLTIRVLGRVKVASLEIGVGETDSNSNFKKQTVAYPSKLPSSLNADHLQKVILKASLVDESTNKPVAVHQAFVLLEHKQSKEEIIFVAEQDTTKAYKFDLDVGARGSDFGHRSGVYSIVLIVGDASLSNSFKWHLADIDLKFNQDSVGTTSESNNITRQPRPEIVHQFRQPEKRPPRLVSDVFSALCAAPLLILFILWVRLGVNVSNFPFSLSALGFHLGLGSILGLFTLFWLKLNMFDTLQMLIPLAIFTFFFGNRLLRSIASKKVEQK